MSAGSRSLDIRSTMPATRAVPSSATSPHPSSSYSLSVNRSHVQITVTFKQTVGVQHLARPGRGPSHTTDARCTGRPLKVPQSTECKCSPSRFTRSAPLTRAKVSGLCRHRQREHGVRPKHLHLTERAAYPCKYSYIYSIYILCIIYIVNGPGLTGSGRWSRRGVRRPQRLGWRSSYPAQASGRPTYTARPVDTHAFAQDRCRQRQVTCRCGDSMKLNLRPQAHTRTQPLIGRG